MKSVRTGPRVRDGLVRVHQPATTLSKAEGTGLLADGPVCSDGHRVARLVAVARRRRVLNQPDVIREEAGRSDRRVVDPANTMRTVVVADWLGDIGMSSQPDDVRQATATIERASRIVRAYSSNSSSSGAEQRWCPFKANYAGFSGNLNPRYIPELIPISANIVASKSGMAKVRQTATMNVPTRTIVQMTICRR